MTSISKTALRIAAPMALLVAGQAAMAETSYLTTDNEFKVVIGGILANFDTSVGLNGNANNGTVIDLDSPNQSKNAGNVFFGGEWRFLGRNRLSAMYFTTSKRRSKTFDQTITIGEDTLLPPTTVDSYAKNDFFFVSYQYSFVRHENLEISGLLGLYANKFKFDLSGTGQVVNGSGEGSGTISKTFAYNPSATVPMPLIGASIDYYLKPQWAVKGSLSGLKAKIGDVDGSVWLASIGTEYMFTRNLGLGLQYMHTRVNVDVTKKTFNGSLDWTNNNFLFYALAKF
jgi:hypothetical protein